jgi:hypothetical protein
VIRVECADLPTGLRAVAHRDASGHVVVYYAAWLTAYERKLAIREARSAVGGGGRHSGGLPTAIWGTAALIVLVGALTALAVFTAPASPQRVRPAGSVTAAPVRHHGRRRENGTPYPDPRPEYQR